MTRDQTVSYVFCALTHLTPFNLHLLLPTLAFALTLSSDTNLILTLTRLCFYISSAQLLLTLACCDHGFYSWTCKFLCQVCVTASCTSSSPATTASQQYPDCHWARTYHRHLCPSLSAIAYPVIRDTIQQLLATLKHFVSLVPKLRWSLPMRDDSQWWLIHIWV